MKALCLAAVVSLSLCAYANAQELMPFADKDEIRYGYSLMPEPVQFQSGGKAMLGFMVMKMDKVKGEITAIGIGGRLALRWTAADGRKEVYVPAPKERLLITQHPLPLFVCDGEAHACKGRVFVVPPLKGMRVAPPPSPAPQPQPTPPLAKPTPTPASPPQALETRAPVRPAIYRKPYFPAKK